MAAEHTPTLRIWHVPNPPRAPYTFPVADMAEAIKLLRLIANYDLYLGDLIFANAQGLEQLTSDGDWEEWEDKNGYDINDTRLAKAKAPSPSSG